MDIVWNVTWKLEFSPLCAYKEYTSKIPSIKSWDRIALPTKNEKNLPQNSRSKSDAKLGLFLCTLYPSFFIISTRNVFSMSVCIWYYYKYQSSINKANKTDKQCWNFNLDLAKRLGHCGMFTDKTKVFCSVWWLSLQHC